MSPRRFTNPHATHIRIWGAGKDRDGFSGGKWEVGRHLASCEWALHSAPDAMTETRVAQMNAIDNQEIIKTGRTPNLTGSTLALYLTFDGRWYRVRTRLETLGRFKRRERAEGLFLSSDVAA